MPSWIRYLPIVGTYSDLQELRARSDVLRAEVSKARAERDRARKVLTHALPYGTMKELVTQHGEAYRTAEPFPHVVLEDVFDPELLRAVLTEFDEMERDTWRSSDQDLERKWSTEDVRHFGPTTRSFINQLNGGLFLNFLEKLTGIEGLIADPHLRGGGLHEIRREGVLGVHADFNLYPRLNVWRRLNLLLYLNENWDPAWGGELEFWDRSGTRRVTSIAPLFNRVVIFDTSNYSYHGHPQPLMCPPDRSRKSIALYYYTVAKPEGEVDPHTTLFVAHRNVEEADT